MLLSWPCVIASKLKLNMSLINVTAVNKLDINIEVLLFLKSPKIWKIPLL